MKPVALLNWPEAHEVQDEREPMDANLPAAHETHDMAADAMFVAEPGRQAVQAVAPIPDANVPVPQSRHIKAAADGEKVPGLHCRHDVPA